MPRIGKLMIISALVILMGAGCVFNNANKAVTSNYPTVTTTPKDYYVNRGAEDNLDAPVKEWQAFSQKKYGWNFSYPEGWKIRTEKTDNQLIVFLSNFSCEDQCPPEFVGLKMKVGIPYTGGNFISFIKNQIDLNNESKIYPGGTATNVKISGRAAVKVARSEWSGAEPWAGYFVALDNDYYAYVSTGRNNLTDRATKAIEKLIGSIRISKNYIPRPGVEEVDDGDNDTGDTYDLTSNNYSSYRYRFALDYPEHCYLSNLTDMTQAPVLLELALCGYKPDERVVGVRVYNGSASETWNSIYNGRDLNYQMKKVLVADNVGQLYTVSAGARSNKERWLLMEKYNRTYIIYVIDDEGRYADDFDKLIEGFEFK